MMVIAGDFPLKLKCLTRTGGHCFFGYYDLPAVSHDKALHLVNTVGFMNRLPLPGDECELGYVDMRSLEYTPFDRTLAWNFQQGALMQFRGAGKTDDVIYNIYENGEYKSRVFNIKTRTARDLPLPLAAVSPDGKHGLSVNFLRIYDFRPGYGYCQKPDPFADDPDPEGDGVFLLDIESGVCKQIISYRTLAERFSDNFMAAKGKKVSINHITFNAASDRFVFLLRFKTEGGSWLTGTGTSDLDGNVYVLRGYSMASHYYWRDDETLMIYADAGEGNGLYELRDLSQEYFLYSREHFPKDIHCSYSPDRRFILGDGYYSEIPGYDGKFRTLKLFDIMKQKMWNIGSFLSPEASPVDIRCDLHARWIGDTTVTLDSVHEGFRGIYKLDLSDMIAETGIL